MRTNWTSELDKRLLESVDKAERAGIHRTIGPRRSDSLDRLPFWSAVAVLMADGPESPSEEACRSRYMIALDIATNPDQHQEHNRINIDPGMADDLKKFDDEWEAAAIENGWDRAKRLMDQHADDEGDTLTELQELLRTAQINVKYLIEKFNGPWD